MDDGMIEHQTPLRSLLPFSRTGRVRSVDGLSHLQPVDVAPAESHFTSSVSALAWFAEARTARNTCEPIAESCFGRSHSRVANSNIASCARCPGFGPFNEFLQESWLLGFGCRQTSQPATASTKAAGALPADS
jgi:hypothetical protein